MRIPDPQYPLHTAGTIAMDDLDLQEYRRKDIRTAIHILDALIDNPDTRDAIREQARERLFARLRSQPVRNIGRWTRDELYDD